MAERVNPPRAKAETATPGKRRYDSSRRQVQAAATAESILVAARRLFEAHGYPATSVANVAAEAGVALKTVYVAYATKAQLLRSVWDVTLRGFADIPVADQPWYREVLEESDPARTLALNARNATVVKRRIGPLTKVIRDGAAADPDVRALWDLIQTDYHANQTRIVAKLAAANALRPGLQPDRASDILWSLVHPDLWHLLVGERAWTEQEYQDWLSDTSIAQLLRQPATTGLETERAQPRRKAAGIGNPVAL